MERVHADPSINPLPKDVYYLFKKWREETLGKESGEGMFIKLEGMVAKYNEDNAKDGGRAVIQRYESKKITTWETRDSAEQPLVLAVCTPLMARAHALVRQAGELVYCDSTASLDRYNSPTFVISTCTSAGGVPLGVVVTSGESEDTITEVSLISSLCYQWMPFLEEGARGLRNA